MSSISMRKRYTRRRAGDPRLWRRRTHQRPPLALRRRLHLPRAIARNNENYVETLIFADNETGAGGTLLLFPGPGKRREGFEELLSNIRWYPEKREIGPIFVDREDPEICRVEGRWRLEGSPPEPKLVFWRRDQGLRRHDRMGGDCRRQSPIIRPLCAVEDAAARLVS
jgi:hypothetical protein